MSEPALSARITNRWNTGPEVERYGTIESEPRSLREGSRADLSDNYREAIIEGGYLHGA
jgi:hypothetical protein